MSNANSAWEAGSASEERGERGKERRLTIDDAPMLCAFVAAFAQNAGGLRRERRER
jgi:hypothetical protein